MSNDKLTAIKGFVVSNIVGIGFISADKYLIIPNSPDASGTVVFSEFVVVPILMGLIASWFWRKLNLSIWAVIRNCLIIVFIATLLSSIFIGEGFICLLIVSPLILLFVLTGAFAGRALFKRDDRTLNISLIIFLIIIFIVDSISSHQYVNTVSDSMIINAPANQVWKNVVAFKKITQPDDFWLSRIGLPSPVQSTVDGYYLGSKRKCIFSNGYVFNEKITTYKKNQNLTFAITNQPRDPEIMNHLDLMQGQFLLKDNGNGTTKLTGSSSYRLYVFPVWYYDIWAQSIVRNVHIRVMEHIKKLSEVK